MDGRVARGEGAKASYGLPVGDWSVTSEGENGKQDGWQEKQRCAVAALCAANIKRRKGAEGIPMTRRGGGVEEGRLSKCKRICQYLFFPPVDKCSPVSLNTTVGCEMIFLRKDVFKHYLLFQVQHFFKYTHGFHIKCQNTFYFSHKP